MTTAYPLPGGLGHQLRTGCRSIGRPAVQQRNTAKGKVREQSKGSDRIRSQVIDFALKHSRVFSGSVQSQVDNVKRRATAGTGLAEPKAGSSHSKHVARTFVWI